MKLFRLLYCSVIASCILASCTSHNQDNNRKEYKSPEQLYGSLFYDVQSNDSIFSDSKTFVDCVPKHDINLIVKRYNKLGKNKNSAILKHFVLQNFIIPQPNNSYKADSSSINHHITSLWKVLKRTPDKHRPGTYIPLPYPYIVPGGRFQEIYYCLN